MDAMERVKSAMEDMDAKCSELTEMALDVEDRINDLHLGIPVQVPSVVRYDSVSRYFLKYGPYGRTKAGRPAWRILVLRVDDQGEVECPIGSVKKEVRIGVLAELPALIDAIQAEVMRKIQDTDRVVSGLKSSSVRTRNP